MTLHKNIIPAYGKKNVLNKLKILNPKINKVSWYGGDFFAGIIFFTKTCIKKPKLIKNIC